MSTPSSHAGFTDNYSREARHHYNELVRRAKKHEHEGSAGFEQGTRAKKSLLHRTSYSGTSSFAVLCGCFQTHPRIKETEIKD